MGGLTLSDSLWKYPKTVNVPMKCGEQLLEEASDTDAEVDAAINSEAEQPIEDVENANLPMGSEP